MNRRFPFLGTVSRKAHCLDSPEPNKKAFCEPHRGHPFASWRGGWLVVFFTDFANVRPVSAFVGEPASLPDPPPDDATWRACAPEWRLWPGACPPQSRSRGHPRRALGRWPVPAKPRNTRAGGSPTGPRADTYIYIYIDSAKPKGAPSGTITSAEFNRACAPKAEVFLQFKSASSQPWTARRSRGSDYSDDATL